MILECHVKHGVGYWTETEERSSYLHLETKIAAALLFCDRQILRVVHSALMLDVSAI